MPADDSLLYACLSHVPLPIEYPPYVHTLHLGAAQGPGRLNLRDLAPRWERFHPILGGTAGAFAVRAWVASLAEPPRHVGICQYRKFVTRHKLGGTPARGYHNVMDMVPAQALDAGRLADEMRPGTTGFLLSRPFTFTHWRKPGSYLRQYARYHCAKDLLRFAATAVELGVLREDELVPFLQVADVFVPGGIELGVYPTSFWLPAMEAVESVVWECANRYPITYEGYQARAWAFCAERLGSWLLLRHFGSTLRAPWNPLTRKLWNRPASPVVWPWIRENTGQLNLVTQGETDYVPGR